MSKKESINQGRGGDGIQEGIAEELGGCRKGKRENHGEGWKGYKERGGIDRGG